MGIAFGNKSEALEEIQEKVYPTIPIGKYLDVGLGITAGWAIGEWVVGWLAGFVEDEMRKILVKAAGKASLSVVLFFVGKRFPSGTHGWLLLNGAAAGLIISLVGDIVEFVTPKEN